MNGTVDDRKLPINCAIKQFYQIVQQSQLIELLIFAIQPIINSGKNHNVFSTKSRRLEITPTMHLKLPHSPHFGTLHNYSVYKLKCVFCGIKYEVLKLLKIMNLLKAVMKEFFSRRYTFNRLINFPLFCYVRGLILFF